MYTLDHQNGPYSLNIDFMPREWADKDQAWPTFLPHAESVSLLCSMEDREKEDKIKEEGQAEYLWAEVTVKKTRRRGQKVEKPEAFMANFFKGLEIYQTKLLVSSPTLPPFC